LGLAADLALGVLLIVVGLIIVGVAAVGILWH
jgi:hypothetical protein